MKNKDPVTRTTEVALAGTGGKLDSSEVAGHTRCEDSQRAGVLLRVRGLQAGSPEFSLERGSCLTGAPETLLLKCVPSSHLFG